MADRRPAGVAHLKVRAVKAFGYLLEEWNHDFGKFSRLQNSTKASEVMAQFPSCSKVGPKCKAPSLDAHIAAETIVAYVHVRMHIKTRLQGLTDSVQHPHRCAMLAAETPVSR